MAKPAVETRTDLDHAALICRLGAMLGLQAARSVPGLVESHARASAPSRGGDADGTFRCFSPAAKARYAHRSSSGPSLPVEDEARARRAFAPYQREIERLVSARVALDRSAAPLEARHFL